MKLIKMPKKSLSYTKLPIMGNWSICDKNELHNRIQRLKKLKESFENLTGLTAKKKVTTKQCSTNTL